MEGGEGWGRGARGALKYSLETEDRTTLELEARAA